MGLWLRLILRCVDIHGVDGAGSPGMGMPFVSYLHLAGTGHFMAGTHGTH